MLASFWEGCKFTKSLIDVESMLIKIYYSKKLCGSDAGRKWNHVTQFSPADEHAQKFLGMICCSRVIQIQSWPQISELAPEFRLLLDLTQHMCFGVGDKS